MTRRLVVLLLACALWLGVLVACQPTGHPRCDAQVDILTEIETAGWSVDCAPGFPPVDSDGRSIGGWADQASQTVYLWPDQLDTNPQLRKLMWHELAHVYGIVDETDAERYSYCREPHDGVAYRLSSLPTAADCRRVGA